MSQVQWTEVKLKYTCANAFEKAKIFLQTYLSKEKENILLEKLHIHQQRDANGSFRQLRSNHITV